MFLPTASILIYTVFAVVESLSADKISQTFEHGELEFVNLPTALKKRSIPRAVNDTVMECFELSDGSDYRGTLSRTANGNVCQKWTSQSPHPHDRTPENYPNKGLGDHNYCRNPDGVKDAWCYTTEDIRWEYCDVGEPQKTCEPADSDDEEEDAMEYILEENSGLVSSNGQGGRILLEGDIYLGKTGQLNNAIRDTEKLWPGGIVPYVFNSYFDDFPEAKEKILTVMDIYKELTCIRFVPRTDEVDYLEIVAIEGCWSSVGRDGGKQPISLAGSCTKKLGIIMHEFMHAIGFYHEQSRTDRNKYIKIIKSNIFPTLESNFRRYGHGKIDDLGTPYDYGSIMHYPAKAFSVNGKPTIVPRRKGVTIGQRNHFSDNDLLKINKLYECDVQTTTLVPTTESPRQSLEECKDLGFFESNSYSYRYPESLTFKHRVDFKVKAATNVHVALTTGPRDAFAMYEIVIGGGDNSYSAIRRSKLFNEKISVSTPGIVSADEFRGFWISYDESTGLIQAGREGEKDPFIEWTDPNPLLINNVGLSSYWGTTVEFFVCMDQPASDHSDIEAAPLVDCTNDYNDDSCEYWSSSGECWKNPNWMLGYCRRSCGNCHQDFDEY